MSIGSYYAAEAIPPSRIAVLLPDNSISLAKSSQIDALGVTRNSVNAKVGDLVTVNLSGSEIVTYGGVVNAGDELTSDGQGRAIKAGPSDKTIGTAEQTGGLGTLGRVDLSTGGFGGVDVARVLSAAQQALVAGQDAANSADTALQHELAAATHATNVATAAVAAVNASDKAKQYAIAPPGTSVDGTYESSLSSAAKAQQIATTSQTIRTALLTSADFPKTITADDFFQTYFVNVSAQVTVFIPPGLFTVPTPTRPHDVPWVNFIPVGNGKIKFQAQGNVIIPPPTTTPPSTTPPTTTPPSTTPPTTTPPSTTAAIPGRLWNDVVARGSVGNLSTSVNVPFSISAPAGSARRLVLISGATFSRPLTTRATKLAISGLTPAKLAGDSYTGNNAAPDANIWSADLASSNIPQTFTGALTFDPFALFHVLWAGIYGDCSGIDANSPFAVSDTGVGSVMNRNFTPSVDNTKLVMGYFGVGNVMDPINLTGLDLLVRGVTGAVTAVNGTTYAIGDLDKPVKGTQATNANYAAPGGRAIAGLILRPFIATPTKAATVTAGTTSTSAVTTAGTVAVVTSAVAGAVTLIATGGRTLTTEVGQTITIYFHGDGQTRYLTGM